MGICSEERIKKSRSESIKSISSTEKIDASHIDKLPSQSSINNNFKSSISQKMLISK